jgi:hypothetical protein
LFVEEAPKKKRRVSQQKPKVTTKKLVADVLSLELQQYFEKIIASLRKSPSQAAASLTDVGKDPGLQPLVVYFVLFVADEV